MNITYIIGGVLIGGGIIYFLYSLFRGFIRPRSIKHYEKIRDKLTLREPEPEPVYESSGGSGFPLGNILGAFIVIMIGMSLIGPISQEVSHAQDMQNVTGMPTETMLTLTVIFFVVTIVCFVLAVTVNLFRSCGLI